MVDLRLPASKRYEDSKSRESSLERSITKPNGKFDIRDEFAKNPKRKQNKIEAWWLEDNQQKAKWDSEWWEKGNYDVVKEQHYWDNGKYIPADIGDKVKEIIQREVKMMKGKM